MKKSLTKRFRITGTGKLVHRTMSKCHFRAKKSSLQLKRASGSTAAAKAITHRMFKKPGTL